MGIMVISENKDTFRALSCVYLFTDLILQHLFFILFNRISFSISSTMIHFPYKKRYSITRKSSMTKKALKIISCWIILISTVNNLFVLMLLTKQTKKFLNSPIDYSRNTIVIIDLFWNYFSLNKMSIYISQKRSL